MVAFDPSARPVSPARSEPIPQELPHSTAFLQHRWVQNVLPLMTSLTVHLGLLALGIALYQAVTVVKDNNIRQTTIPQSAMIAKADLPGIPHAKATDLQLPEARQDSIRDSLEDGSGTTLKNNLSQLANSGANEDAAMFQGLVPANSGNGTGHGLLADAGSGTAPFGRLIAGQAPQVGLITDKRYPARKVIYLCDASGSMLGVFGALKQKLKESVDGLDVKAGAEFNVIFFSDDNVFPLFKDGTHMANDDNKKLAMDFIDNAVSTGGTQPLPAIRFAVAEKPDLMFVLTDGFDQIANFDDVINAFKDGNRDGKIRINCIFLESDPDPQLEKTLRQIARDGRGEYTKIRKQDM